MGTLYHVMHTGARPIGLPEFMDALRAISPPRFPFTRGSRRRQVAMAVSGGVDSMALAFLCSQVRKLEPDFKFSDNVVSNFRGFIVDHGLRPESSEEAKFVCKALHNMDFSAEIFTLQWSKTALRGHDHPKDLPNLESVARRLRYQKLGFSSHLRKIASLLLAHHEDDQYETLLMRLLQGHGSRGLRGMQKAQDIPECEGLFGANRSGYIDDQRREFPYYDLKPSRRECKSLRQELKSEMIDPAMLQIELNGYSATGLIDVDLAEIYQPSDVPIEEMSPWKRSDPVEINDIEVEDGGVTVYRPLLEFSKDRLIATCVENNVPWWEDATNKDPTLTMRNAVRHLHKGYTLPVALQKPAILALSKRCELRAQAQEAEANRLLSRTIIHDFETYVGTVTVQFPVIKSPLTKRDLRSPLRRRARLARRREVAAIVLRRILELVTPELHSPLLATLVGHVARLFSSLASPDEATLANHPKAFTVAGVHLVPIEYKPDSKDTPQGTSEGLEQPRLAWYLSRAPYSATKPLPRVHTPYRAVLRDDTGLWKGSRRTVWKLWDGRYWINIYHRLPYRLVVQPFLIEHVKIFRELLSENTKYRLAALLKKYAPGKVRYTLPGLYLEEPLDLESEDVEPRPGYPNPVRVDNNANANTITDDGTGTPAPAPSLHPRVLDVSKMKLLALPTLGIHIPNLERWASYKVRYRKADPKTLSTAGSFSKGSFGTPRVRGREPGARRGRVFGTSGKMKKMKRQGVMSRQRERRKTE
ncbi:adenine nucleotide alpha hydrolases-like protein [Hypoxylon fragiforme]|uniref:adenine nucleotide alpha hydrolases-like protein n=1 Tax=Hypoxylon fragiforme TaxID=63214 RepID=UPI0020C636B2|nr:adenine nucleotide alpha hydrolases-like protein [Hypoxylon fragiforme]KAI2611386.1 adenine nucleotide alpha hydrolases-like protein [Hypoxylon fragiforme]